MHNVVAEMLLNEPAPMAIWAVLMLLTLPALLVLGSPHGLHAPGRALRDLLDLVRESRAERRQRQLEAVGAARFADEVRAAANRAGHAAQRWQEHWEQTEQARETAWMTWLEADARVRRSLAATAFGTRFALHTPAEYAAREQFLHRTVQAAADRGELPVAAVADALAGRAGWDATLDPATQELVVHRAAAAHLRAAYQRACVTEYAARHDAHLAARTRDSLRQESTEAAVRAAALHHLLPAADPTGSREAAARRHVTQAA